MATLKALRVEKMWSQEELAVKAGVSTRTVTACELGTATTSVKTRVKLAKVLRVAVTAIDWPVTA